MEKGKRSWVEAEKCAEVDGNDKGMEMMHAKCAEVEDELKEFLAGK
jgi:hypothetical protein